MPKYKDFEDFLMTKHAEQYVGTKDCMVDDFVSWLEELSHDEWITFGDMFGFQKYSQALEDYQKKMKEFDNAQM